LHRYEVLMHHMHKACQEEYIFPYHILKNIGLIGLLENETILKNVMI